MQSRLTLPATPDETTLKRLEKFAARLRSFEPGSPPIYNLRK